jgi:hypothetical protein
VLLLKRWGPTSDRKPRITATIAAYRRIVVPPTPPVSRTTMNLCRTNGISPSSSTAFKRYVPRMIITAVLMRVFERIEIDDTLIVLTVTNGYLLKNYPAKHVVVGHLHILKR